MTPILVGRGSPPCLPRLPCSICCLTETPSSSEAPTPTPHPPPPPHPPPHMGRPLYPRLRSFHLSSHGWSQFLFVRELGTLTSHYRFFLRLYSGGPLVRYHLSPSLDRYNLRPNYVGKGIVSHLCFSDLVALDEPCSPLFYNSFFFLFVSFPNEGRAWGIAS